MRQKNLLGNPTNFLIDQLKITRDNDKKGTLEWRYLKILLCFYTRTHGTKEKILLFVYMGVRIAYDEV